MRKAILLISIVCFLFLLSTIILFYIPYGNDFIQFAVELFTIPAIIFVCFAFVYSLINVLIRKNEYNLILGLNTLALLFMVFATVADYK